MAGLSDGPMPVVSWAALAARPELAAPFEHLVALDPPSGGIADPLLHVTPRAHLAWGPAEAEFAIAAYRAALDLRPQLTEVYRALRELPQDAPATGLEAGAPRTRPLPPRGRRLRAPAEGADGARPDRAGPRCAELPGGRGGPVGPRPLADVPKAREQLEATERALVAELPRPLTRAATG